MTPGGKRFRLPKVQPGEVFAVPLDRGGYGVGVIGRVDGIGGALGYFFGPKRPEPSLLQRENFQASDAVYAVIFGTTALEIGAWPRLACLYPFKPEDWPMPLMAQWIDVETGPKGPCFAYEDDGSLWNRKEVPCPDDMSTLIAKAVNSPNGAVEVMLTAILDPPWWQRP